MPFEQYLKIIGKNQTHHVTSSMAIPVEQMHGNISRAKHVYAKNNNGSNNDENKKDFVANLIYLHVWA